MSCKRKKTTNIIRNIKNIKYRHMDHTKKKKKKTAVYKVDCVRMLFFEIIKIQTYVPFIYLILNIIFIPKCNIKGIRKPYLFPRFTYMYLLLYGLCPLDS